MDRGLWVGSESLSFLLISLINGSIQARLRVSKNSGFQARALRYMTVHDIFSAKSTYSGGDRQLAEQGPSEWRIGQQGIVQQESGRNGVLAQQALAFRQHVGDASAP